MKTTNIRKSLRRIFIFTVAAASFLLLTAFSPWEGAAAVAPAGELPASGFFVATNSFPMNTVVDITNIESGKSTRVIVAATLNSPGLLAIVSREVADLIDMRSGSVSRVRMIQPSDPMAYMRFTESIAVGTPMYSSANGTRDEYLSNENLSNEERSNLEERLLEEHYSEDTYTPPPAQVQHTAAVQEPVVREEIVQRGYIVNEPEWGGSGRLNIVDVPGFYIDPVEKFPESVTEPEPVIIVQEEKPLPVDEPVYENPVIIAKNENLNIEPEYEEPIYFEPEPEYFAEEPFIEETPIETTPSYFFEEKTEVADNSPASDSKIFVKDVSDRRNENTQIEIIKDVSDRSDEKFKGDKIKDTPVYYTHDDKREINKDIPMYYMADGSRNEIVKDIPVWMESEEKIAESPVEEPVVEIAQESEPEEPVIEEPVEVVKEEPPVAPLVPVEAEERLPPSTVYDIPLTDIIPEIVQTPPAKEPEPPAPVPPAAPPVIAQPSPSFSVRTISQLDSGKFYVQLAALADDNVDNAVRQIDRRYDPVVYKDRDNLNRILIGPLNQGESAAILQRFKSIGYKDAFVRRGN